MKPLLRVICLFWITSWISASSLNAQLPAQDSLLRLLDAHPQQDDRRAELLNGLAFLLHTSQPDQTLAYVDEVIGFVDKLKDKKKLSSAYSVKAIAYIVKSDLQNAEMWAKKSLEIDQRIGHKPGIASNTSNLGLIYYRQNNYPFALLRFQEAAQLFKETSNPNEIMMYLNMSAIYAETKNFRKAEEYIQLARSRNKQVNDPRLDGYALLNLGTLYTDEGDYQKGRIYLDSALAVNQKTNDQSNIAKAYGNLGSSYAKTHDYQRSKIYYQQALAINTTLGNSRSIAVNHCGIGESYLMLDSLLLAYHHLSVSRATSEQLHAIDIQRDVSQNLSRYFEKTGRLDSALYYHKQFLLLKDSLDNEANRKQLTRLELQYDFDLKEQEYIQQQAISKLQIKQLWLYGVLLVVLLISLTGYLLNRSRIRGIRLRNEMREKELSQQAESLLLQQQLSESELKAIRSQMNPHFIFNVLNSIESYILENDAKSASQLVQQFARLTRLVLENSTQALVSADREWMCIQLYTQLEATRFEHSFDYDFQVEADLNLTEIVLPPMLIQPLIENAILHGLRHARGYRGMLSVSIATEAPQTVIISVKDNGIGREKARKLKTNVGYKQKSMGIEAIHERLALCKLSNPTSTTQLEYLDPEENGTEVRLRLPLIRREQYPIGGVKAS